MAAIQEAFEMFVEQSGLDLSLSKNSKQAYIDSATQTYWGFWKVAWNKGELEGLKVSYEQIRQSMRNTRYG